MVECYTALQEIPVTRDHIEKCSYSNWYPLFKDRVPISRIIRPLPKEFVEYLEQDGIKLAKSDRPSAYTQEIVRDDDNGYSDWDGSEAENDKNDGTDKEDTTCMRDPLVDFSAIHNQIRDIIAEIGPVTPKLNWSAPRDATWILPTNTMKCSEANEIYLLLNASNYIMHDLQYALSECSDVKHGERPQYELVLRKWFDINPALEFRVFIKERQIICISQRDLNHYPFIETDSKDFKRIIEEFVEGEFLTKFSERNCVADVYIPKPYGKLYLIDINPFTRITDPLLFSWNEILTIKPDQSRSFELRYVTKNNIGRFASKEHSENQVPKDVVDATLDPNAIRELTAKWQELLNKQESEESDSD
ncbi:hypothetical protein HG535_0E04870 [Zygotorulaspora mrakii]|uniref:Translation initiation factor eIF2 assembly protein n=1 Tax=Zygotorulaspora mrakii TaxID=42260 RepID=A0A7H9B4L8_ZYGMR|nr:uncharacterized protein HG535_0E04870 [Zygotorulaspora mrakii]QLG73403.1 hypothetical protein HG535_0E04870 [Zygotorulaspora mrakii]